MNEYAAAQKAFAALRSDHDLLLVDNRGSGASEAISCPKVQQGAFTSAAVAQCRTILGSHANDYGTIAAVDDLESVLQLIHAGNVDLYGESYGTFFAQVFALRYPQHLQRLVLDGALPLDVDPWQRDSPPTGLAALRTTCRADPACRSLGDPVALVAEALARFRVGIPPGDLSKRAYELALLVANAGRAGSAYRELPAALRSYLAGDDQPLLRLLGEALEGGFGNGPGLATNNSYGLLLAGECTDYPHPFDLHAPLAVQKRQFDQAYKTISATVAQALLPFTPEEALHYPPPCLGWPAPTSPTPQALPRVFPDVPTLVLEGSLDTVTPPRGAHSVANEFRGSRYVVVPFVGHITVFNDTTGCAASVAAEFLAARTVATTCLAHLEAPPQVDAFPVKFSQEPPITPIDAEAATNLSTNDRRTIAIARDAISDVMWRWAALHEVDGHGLRGGTFESASPLGSIDYRLDLEGIRWTNDTTVTGDVVTYPDKSMTASIDVVTPAGESQLNIACPNSLGPSTVETISGANAAGYFKVRVNAKLGL